MKDYNDIAHRVFSRGDEILAAQMRKRTIVKRTAAAISGTAAEALIGLAVWSSDAMRKAPDFSDFLAPTETTAAENTEAAEQTATEPPVTEAAVTCTAAAETTAMTAPVKVSHYTNTPQTKPVTAAVTKTDLRTSPVIVSTAQTRQTAAVNASTAAVTAAATHIPVTNSPVPQIPTDAPIPEIAVTDAAELFVPPRVTTGCVVTVAPPLVIPGCAVTTAPSAEERVPCDDPELPDSTTTTTATSHTGTSYTTASDVVTSTVTTATTVTTTEKRRRRR